MKTFSIRLLTAVFLVIALAFQCQAKTIQFEARIDKSKVSIRQSVILSLSFHGTQNIPAPDLSRLEGFDVQYMGPSTLMSVVNGKMSVSVTHKYILIPLEVGQFTLGPFSFDYDGNTYTARTLMIEVFEKAAAVPPSSQAEPEVERINFDERIFMTLEVAKSTAYLNEIVPVAVKLFINKLPIRDVHYPEMTQEGFSIAPYDEPVQYESVLGGVFYDVVEFKTSLFATRPGTIQVGPAQLQCTLVKRQKKRRSVFDNFFGRDNNDAFSNFFGRYKRYPIHLKSLTIPMTILPFPQEGKPPDFNGAIGDYKFRVDAEPREVKEGDPITIKMTISGEGNFKTVSSPSIDFGDQFKTYEPEVRQDEASKTFEQVVIPTSVHVQQIPQIGFSFFDPESKQYRTVRRGPFPVTVSPLAPGEELKIFDAPERFEDRPGLQKREILGRDIIYIKDTLGTVRQKGEFLYNNRVFVGFQFIPLIAVLSVFAVHRRRQRLQTDVRYARRLQAPRKARKNLSRTRRLLDAGKTAEFYDAVFKTLQEYIGDKFHLPTAGITVNVVNVLGQRGVANEITGKIQECFSGCDMARYTPSKITRDDMIATFKLLAQAIDELERIKV